MNVKWARSLFGMLAFALGCTQGTPSFEVLDQSKIPMPMFSGATVLHLVDTTATQTNAIVGQCDHKIHDLQVGAVGSISTFSTAAALTTSGITVSCGTTGQFSFTLKSLTDLGFVIKDNTAYDIQLRSVTDGGISNPSTIHILYSTTGGEGPKRVLITSGSTISNTDPTKPRIATSANFRAEIRVDHMLNDYSSAGTQGAMSLKSSANFRMKTGVAAEHD